MTISYPLSLPTAAGIAQITLRGRNVNTSSDSPFTFAQQIVSHPGQRWEAEVSLPPMNRADAEEWIAFLFSLKGTIGTFLMGDPAAATPRGSAGGTPLVNGASQTGSALVLDGATVSQTGWLKAGDYIQLGSGSTTTLHKVLADANSDGSGNVTLDIWPDLRSSPADNAAVTVSGTLGRWRLTTPFSEFDIGAASIYGLTFAAVEALGV